MSQHRVNDESKIMSKGESTTGQRRANDESATANDDVEGWAAVHRRSGWGGAGAAPEQAPHRGGQPLERLKWAPESATTSDES